MEWRLILYPCPDKQNLKTAYRINMYEIHKYLMLKLAATEGKERETEKQTGSKSEESESILLCPDGYFENRIYSNLLLTVRSYRNYSRDIAERDRSLRRTRRNIW